jgi:hypothetical protein
MRRIAVSLICVVAVVLGGCRAKEAFDKASIAKDLHNRGTLDVLKQTAEDKYTPPADGRLTDGQVQMYLKVREHEKQIAQVAKKELEEHSQKAKEAGEKSLSGMMEGFKGLGSVGNLLTADIRASKDLGYNTQEYLWVKGQILAVSTAVMTEKMGQAMNASLDASYQQMKKAYAEAKDDTSKKMYADMLASYDKSRQEMNQQKQKEDPALAYNKQLVSKYENALNALTNEMAKYESKEGESQKSMDQWQKDMDKATADAKAQAKK